MAFILEDDPNGQAQAPQGRFILEDAPRADPKIGQPEDLTFAEKYVAPVLDKLGTAVQSDPGVVGAAARFFLNNGNARGAVPGRVFQGAADPGTALAQIAAHAAGFGDDFDAKIAAREREYQAARKGAGSEGFDPARVAGSYAVTAPLAPLGNTVLRGAALGAGLGALDPVRDEGDNFWTEKAKQVGFGAAGGAVMTPLMGALARVISPRASVNPDLKLLRGEGVNPTVGQSLGGWANTAEEKATSLPLVGDRIAAMRRKAIDEFNQAAINRTVAPIGERVEGSGSQAVAEAGDKLSAAYNAAASNVGHINFNTPAFNQQFGQLQQMATGLSEPLQKRFASAVNDVLLRKMSPNGSIAGADLKAVDSELGLIARRYGKSSVASEQELGDAVKQLQAIVRDEMARSDPAYAAAKAAADKGWANLVRVEGASKRAVNNSGTFTPGQLNLSVRSTDSSVRGRATARGQALMQDLSEAGQNVLGNKYPDSGTAGRLMLGGGAAAATTLLHPAAAVGVAAGMGAYTPVVQNFLRELIVRRPNQAPAVANYLRQLIGPATVATAPMLQQANQ
jgi:hypothetical protein